MSDRKRVAKRRKRLSIEPLEPRRLLDVSGIWQELGFRSASGGGISNDGHQFNADTYFLDYGHSGDPAVANLPNGETVMVYENDAGLQAKLFDGFAWNDIYVDPNDPTKLALPGTDFGRDPDVAVDANGSIYVTWLSDVDDDADVYLLKGSLEFNPDTELFFWTWSGLGGSDDGTGISSDGVINGPPAVAVGPDNLPVVTYSARDPYWGDMDVVAKKWIGGRWVELTSTRAFTAGGGGVSNDTFASAGWADDPQPVDIAIGSDNAPIVVWSSSIDQTTPAQIYARRWDQVSSTWQKIGGDSASDPNEDPATGISADPGNSVYPRIAVRRVGEGDVVDDRDIVMVTWLDYTDVDDLTTGAVFVKELTFTPGSPATASWTEVSPGSASGDGITAPLDFTPDNLLTSYIGEFQAPRGMFRYPSIDIGADGLPVIGITHRQPVHPEYFHDVTFPWGTPDGWFAYGLEAVDGGGTTSWRLMGPTDFESPNYSVSWAQNTEIIELADGSPALFYGADRIFSDVGENSFYAEYTMDRWFQAPYSGSSSNGGPWDPFGNPFAMDSEVYAHKWNADESTWEDLGDGSGQVGGVDNDIRWNSDPVLANLDDGRSVMSYLERIGSQLFLRVKVFNQMSGRWETFGQEEPLVIDMNPADVGEFEDFATATYGDHTYRYDELVIGADPGFTSSNVNGRPVIAYLDYVNTDDPTVLNKSTLTVLAFNETTEQWERLSNGTTGEDKYAYVTEGTVWEGYLIDQIDVAAGHNDMAFVSFRYVDPTEHPDDKIKVDHAHIEDVLYGGNTPYTTDAQGNGLHGTSEIYALEWDGSSWGAIGDPEQPMPEMWPINLSGIFGDKTGPYGSMMLPYHSGGWNSYGEFHPSSWYSFEGMNFDPSLLLTPDGDVWIAFTVGRTGKHWKPNGQLADWWVNYETPTLLTEIVVYQYDPETNSWDDRFGDSTCSQLRLSPDAAKGSYAHADLALGSNNRPILVFEDQMWEPLRLQEINELAGNSHLMSSDPNDRPLIDDDPNIADWGVFVADGAEPQEVVEDPDEAGLDFADNWTVAELDATNSRWGASFEGLMGALDGEGNAMPSTDVDFFVLSNLEPYRSYNVTVDADFTYGPYYGLEDPPDEPEGRAILGWWDPDAGAWVEIRNSGEWSETGNPQGIDDAHPFEIPADVNGEIYIALTGYDDFDFDGLPDSGGFPPYKDFGTFTLTVEQMDHPGWRDRVYVAEDGFQQLQSSSIKVYSYEEEYVGGSDYWVDQGTISPDSGRANILPKAVSVGNGEVVITYTNLELDKAGFTTSLVTEWYWDVQASKWLRSHGWNNIDLGIRSYFEGEYGEDGLMDYDFLYLDYHDYSDPICDPFDPRIMFGARELDFEKAWWQTLNEDGGPANTEGGQYAPPGNVYARKFVDDYLTPLPGDGHSALSTRSHEQGHRADGHTVHTSFIHATRVKKNPVGAWEFEQLTSQDAFGNTLPSSEGNGLNSWVNLPDGMDIAWTPGFISDVGVRGLGTALNDAQPVVAWNLMEMNLIHVRGWAPDGAMQVNLPKLVVTELSGTPNDNLLEFGRLQTVEPGTPLGDSEYYRVIELKNTGDEELVIYDIQFGGPGIFTATDVGNNDLTYPLTIAPGDDEIVRIQVTPTEPGPIHGMIYIESNDPLQEVDPDSRAPYQASWYTLAMQGVAREGGDIEVTEDVATPNDLAIPFGLLETGETSSRIVTIANNGTGDLTVRLNISGTALDTYESFRIKRGTDLLSSTTLIIAPGESEDVEIVFSGTDANETGVIACLEIEHDDWGGELGFDPVSDRRPYLVQLIGNMPSVEDNIEVAQGTVPALSLNTVVYRNASGGLSVYDITTGVDSELVSGSTSKPRSDGNLTVYAVGNALFVYDHTLGEAFDLTEFLNPELGTNANNPSIDGTRVVFSGPGFGERDIHVVDLNVVSGTLVAGDPVIDHRVIEDVDPGDSAIDDHPDVSGDLVVWRRGSAEGEYSVWGYDLALDEPLLLSVGDRDGARIPRASGDFVTWIEHDGGNKVVIYERNVGPSTLFRQQADMSDEVDFYGSLLVWSDNRNGNYDVFGYYLPSAVLGGTGVDIRDRQFQLTFTTNDELDPDVWGNSIAWRALETDPVTGQSVNKIYFSEVPYGVPDMHVPVEGTNLDFGDIVVGVPSEMEFVIENVGTGPLTIDVLTSDNFLAELVPMSQPGSGDDIVLQQGSTMTIKLILTAAAVGPLNGTVTIQSLPVPDADYTGELATFTFSATAQVSDVLVTEDSGTANDDLLELGDLLVGETASATFTILNESSVAPLIISDIDTGHEDLTVTYLTGSSTLQPGEQALIELTWAPSAAMDLSGIVVQVVTNDPDESPWELNLSGVATGIPAIRVEDNAGAANDDLVNYGNVDKGSGLLARTVTVFNEGTADLTVTHSLTGPGAYAYTLRSGGVPLPTSFTVAAGDSRVITVLFDTSTGGTYKAALNLVTNDPDLGATPYVVDIEGVVKSGVVFVTQGEIDFGDVEIGDSSSPQEFAIVNAGQAPLQIMSVESTNPSVFILTAPAGQQGAFTLASGERSQTFTVVFAPASEQDYQAAIRVVSDDPTNPTLELPALLGSGVFVPNMVIEEPGGEVTDREIDFGEVRVGETATTSIRIKNTGTDTLRLTSWTSDNMAYTILPTGGATGPVIELGPGQYVDMQIAFTPPATVMYPGTITIVSDDPDPSEGVFEIEVTGRGMPQQVVGDFSGDGRLDATDYDLFKTAFGSTSSDAGWDPAYDFDADGDVDFSDLGIFLAYFNEQFKSTPKTMIASYLTPLPEGGADAAAASPSLAAQGASASFKVAASSKAGDNGRAESRFYAGLSDAFHTGALSTEDGADEASVASADVQAAGLGDIDAPAPVASSGGATIELSPVVPLGDLSAGPLAMSAGSVTSEAGSLSVEDLGDVDPVLSSYASALLPSEGA